jgi:hypothetical protein
VSTNHRASPAMSAGAAGLPGIRFSTSRDTTAARTARRSRRRGRPRRIRDGSCRAAASGCPGQALGARPGGGAGGMTGRGEVSGSLPPRSPPGKSRPTAQACSARSAQASDRA